MTCNKDFMDESKYCGKVRSKSKSNRYTRPQVHALAKKCSIRIGNKSMSTLCGQLRSCSRGRRNCPKALKKPAKRKSVKKTSSKRKSKNPKSVKRNTSKRKSVKRTSSKKNTLRRNSVKRTSSKKNTSRRNSLKRTSIKRESNVSPIKLETSNSLIKLETTEPPIKLESLKRNSTKRESLKRNSAANEFSQLGDTFTADTVVAIRKAKGDGSCFYHTLAVLLNMPDDDETIRTLRMSVANYIREHASNYNGFRADDNAVTLQNIIKKIEGRYEWANDFVISTIANMMNIRLVIVRINSDTLPYDKPMKFPNILELPGAQVPYPISGDNPTKTLYMVHLNNSHFDPIVTWTTDMAWQVAQEKLGI